MKTRKLLIFVLFILLLGIGCNNTRECEHTIENIKAQEATCIKEGNIEYYYCTKCNKYYTDEKLTTEVKHEDLVLQKTSHTESDWIIDTEATCSNQGLKHKECTVCKEKLQEEVIGETEHSYTETIINPTCEKEGYTLHKCLCGDEYKDTYVEALGHTEEIISGIDATCTESGLTEGKKCSVCGEILVKQEVIKAKGHNHTETVIAPTCTKQGYTIHTCHCGDSYKDTYVDALGHTEEIISGLDATCTESGLTEGKKCSVCGEILVNQEVIKAKGHNHTETVIAPTCTEDGYTIHKCHCGDEYKDTYVNALGHTEEIISGLEATCTENGLTEGKKCSACGEILVKQEVIKIKEHNYGDWIIVKPATEQETGLKTRKCLDCEKEETVEIPTLDHIHSYDETVIAPTCTEDGYTIHKCHCGDEYKDTYVNALGHTEEIISGLEATCTESGLTEGKKCSVCGEILVKQEVIKAKGHNHSTSNIVLLDEGNKAVTRYYCSNCTSYKDEIYSGYYLLNDIAYEFDNSGNRINLNESFIEVNGNTYYIINNTIIKNYYIIDGTIYDFGSDGIKQETVLTDTIITFEDNLYYVINNIIQKEVFIVYEQCIYFFDETGKALVNTTYNGYTFNANGYLIGNDILIEINKVLYYVVNNIASVHNHSLEHKLYNPATCTADGNIEYFYCTICNRLYKDNECINEITNEDIIIKASHNITKYEGKESTCTEQGYKAYEKCANCSYTTFTYLPLKEHTLTDWIIDTEATCTQTGSKHKECSVCENILETETIEVFNHNYENGKCTICGKTQNASTESKIWQDNGYVYFGEYPQTLKEESITIVSDTPNSDGYYLGSDGERYAKVTAKPYSSSYYFNGNASKIVKGTTYYFKVEPIRWKIEEQSNDTYKLICDLVIDCQMYYSSKNERTIDGQTIYANNYKYSDIRSWLNNEFLNKTFTEDLQEYINVTEVDNSALSTGYSENEYVCENTMDKIYLPSYEEMCKYAYGYSTDSLEKDYARQKQLTDYAKAMGCSMNTTDDYYNSGSYWLRSSTNYIGTYVRGVSTDGYVFNDYINHSGVGVIPSMSITKDNIPFMHNIVKCEGKESTCTEYGYEPYEKCIDCSYTTFTYLPLKEHTLTDWIIDSQATCMQTGSKHKECTVCENVVETETIEAIGHNYINNICTKCNIKRIEVGDKEILIGTGYIYFGEYPQTLKEESVTIVSDAPDSDGYYLGSDGERYAKVTAKPYPYPYSSYYFNDKTTKIVKGTTYYFKVEPIRWKIEAQTNSTYKLISDLIIDCQKYHSSTSTRTIDGKTICANNYEYSDIRNWLNNEFLNKAFQEVLQEYINVTEVDNSASSTEYSENKYACENTMDKIYLPSRAEMLKAEYDYRTSSGEDTARQKQLTDYAKAMGCFMNTTDDYYNNGYYWLRSPFSDDSDGAYFVHYYGNVRNYYVYDVSIGVAPALTIQID